ncbi:hypothetical protein GF351_00300 [Candidatus Woesearchaeota archaeon]|nr:hypothetical protein [Candidatus Woesearchaeota archaeon]
MKTFNKKGVWAWSELAKYILALLFIIAGFAFIDRIRGVSEDVYNKELCQISVILNAKIKRPILGSEHTPIDCPTRYVDIDLDRIAEEVPERDMRHETPIRCRKGFMGMPADGVDLDDEESVNCFVETVNSYIADLHFDCWDQFGAGRLAVFGWESTERKCVICSVVNFDEVVSADIDQAYLQENPYDDYLRSNSPPGHDITYYQYLLDDADTVDLPYFDYTYDDDLAIVFMNEYEGRIRNLIEKFGAPIKCAGKWGFYKVTGEGDTCEVGQLMEDLAAPPEYINQNDLTRYQEVTSYCDVLK